MLKLFFREKTNHKKGLSLKLETNPRILIFCHLHWNKSSPQNQFWINYQTWDDEFIKKKLEEHNFESQKFLNPETENNFIIIKLTLIFAQIDKYQN